MHAPHDSPSGGASIWPRPTATADDHAGDALVTTLKPAHAGVPYARDLARGERALDRVQELLERELRIRRGEGGTGFGVSVFFGVCMYIGEEMSV
jgi:hypothetical protein